ncbi:16S rRNA (uracil(1498)-N(3))-methyltransferase [Dermacoccaceae bacterium W4C1]
MTAPLFWCEAALLVGVRPGQSVRLDGPEGRHAATVRRIGVGESVQLADGESMLVHGTVEAAERDALQIRIDLVEVPARPAVPLTLVQALAKDGRDLMAIEAATELGVDHVVPWQSERSIVTWKGERALKAHAKWAATVQAAAKQARRPVRPTLAPLARRGDLAELVEASALTLVLHEEASEALPEVRLPSSGEVAVVVGPEGGITDTEMQVLIAAGARSVRLGPTVLRSSTAGPAALAVLAAQSRW